MVSEGWLFTVRKGPGRRERVIISMQMTEIQAIITNNYSTFVEHCMSLCWYGLEFISAPIPIRAIATLYLITAIASAYFVQYCKGIPVTDHQSKTLRKTNKPQCSILPITPWKKINLEIDTYSSDIWENNNTYFCTNPHPTFFLLHHSRNTLYLTTSNTFSIIGQNCSKIMSLSWLVGRTWLWHQYIAGNLYATAKPAQARLQSFLVSMDCMECNFWLSWRAVQFYSESRIFALSEIAFLLFNCSVCFVPYFANLTMNECSFWLSWRVVKF